MKALIRSLFLAILICVSFLATAQHSIKGQLFNDSLKNVGNATVSLVEAKDSSISQIKFSDDKGRFSFDKIEKGDYFLMITVLNYRPTIQPVSISDKKEYVFDSIFLSAFVDTLEAVTVVSTRMPVVIKTDTTEYHADAFKTMPNATVEDLLKKMPAMEVDKEGNVKAQGEKITKVLVDGKPFFGGDPQTAIQNLPANIIDKVQLIDERTEQAKNTKVDDGIREKVLNLTIKKDKKKGYFASANAAYGTDGRYEGALSANYFKGETKLSMVATGTNTGRSGYSTANGEVNNFNGGSGLPKDRQIRFSLNDQVSKKFDYNASIGYSANENTRLNTRNRQNIFGDSITNYFEQSVNKNTSKRINGNLSFDWKPDTMTSIRFNQSGGYSMNTSTSDVSFISRLAKNAKVLNQGDRKYNNGSNAPTFNGQLSINKRFKKDRNLFLSVNNNINESLAENFNISNNYFYPISGADYSRLFNQFTNNTTRFTNVNTNLSYNQKLVGKVNMSTGYSFNYGKNTTIRETFDYNTLNDLYDMLNDSLSNRFVNHNYGHNVNFNINTSWKKGGMGLGVRYNKAITKGRSFTTDSTYRQEFSGFSPNANLYLSGKNKRFNLNYNFNIRPPQAAQLQPVIDNTNPLYIRLGNPYLKYATTHSTNFNFNYFNNKKEFNIHTNGNFNYTFNQITNSNVFDKATGQQVTQPVNLDGAYNFYSYVNLNMPLKPGQQKNKIYLNASINYNRNRNVSLLNYQRNSSINENTGGNVSIRWDSKDVIMLGVNLNVSRQQSRYAIQSNLNNVNNNYGVGADADLRIGKLTQIKIDYNLRTTTGQSAGFNRQLHLINASYIQYFSQKRNMWVSLRGFDILKQNVSINRFVGENYIEDFQTNAITRFFLLSFNYKLNRFGGKQTAPSSAPRSGRVHEVIGR